MSQVAAAPKVALNRLVSLRELDHEKLFNLMPQKGQQPIDLSLLMSHLTPQGTSFFKQFVSAMSFVAVCLKMGLSFLQVRSASLMRLGTMMIWSSRSRTNSRRRETP